MRDALNSELKAAMKAGDKRRVETIRMINAAIKDRDIEARGQGKSLSDADLLTVMQKMVKSRLESLDIYTKAGRSELAEQEAQEIAVIRSFLPQQLDDDATAKAVEDAIAATAASGIKDMGRVVGLLKEKYAGTMDFAKASALAKAKLGG